MTLKSKERTEALGSAEPALHTLRATPKTCHWGYFDAARAPALRVRSGDMIRAEAVTHHAGDAPELLMDDGITAIFDGIPESDRNPGVHIMTGPIYVEGAKAGDVLEVRYLQMTPRVNYGSNLAANWGYLYKEFGETERVTIYQLDPNSQQASAMFAYEVKEKYLTPGRITHAKDCCREPALEGIRVPVRPHLGVRRAKTALSSGCKPHPATAPAGSNRSSHGGNEVAEAIGSRDCVQPARTLRTRLNAEAGESPTG